MMAIVAAPYALAAVEHMLPTLFTMFILLIGLAVIIRKWFAWAT